MLLVLILNLVLLVLLMIPTVKLLPFLCMLLMKLDTVHKRTTATRPTHDIHACQAKTTTVMDHSNSLGTTTMALQAISSALMASTTLIFWPLTTPSPSRRPCGTG
ncbi:hypothetical protein RJ641_004597 [Dillenia turbinata]|uniref:Uncharacterized protein n=1 Tax=Dillenia turbinata TaxID=194707 RepID=A0AAN8V8V1_9MAGN